MAVYRRFGSAAYVTAVMGAIWFAIQIQRFSLAVYVGASSLMPDLGITAAAAGFLASVYFPVYGLVQIPSGILADQGNPRLNILVASLVTCAAALAFAFAPGFEAAVAARVVIGVGSGFLWMSQLKLLRQLSNREYARRLGLVSLIGGFGNILVLGGLPLLLSVVHWRPAAVLITLPTLLTVLALLTTDTPRSERVSATAFLSRSLGLLAKVPTILRRIEYWRVISISLVWMGSHFAVVTWLPRYGRDALALPPEALGLLPAIVPIGQILGNALASRAIASRPNLQVPILVGSCFGYVVVLAALASGLAASLGTAAIFVVALALGTMFGPFFLSLAWIGGVVEPELMGTATGTINGMSFASAFFLPWMMGVLLDVVDRPSSAAWRYSAGAYDVAFGLLVVVMVIALAASTLVGVYASRKPARRAAQG